MSIESHFFIEQDAFLANTALQSFGPQSSNEFNLTTSFSLSGEKKAYSICKGVVLIQPQTDSTTKVNLILRPFTQPYKGLNVKYFIYRGLKRSDFFTGDLVKTRDTGTPSSTSDFINKINIDYDDFYKPLTPPPFPSKFIGYDDSEDAPDDSTLLSKFFFKESQFVEAGGVFEEEENTAFELPMIDKGKWLGNFADGECGIDVVLNYGDYEHEFDSGEFVFNLSYARAVKAKITLSGGESTVEKKIKREQITQFIDIAAFYGLFIPEGKVNVHNPQGEVSAKNGTAIYNDLLVSFFNKHKVYIYISSDRNRSYNYYDNYQLSQININNIRLKVLDDYTETTYGEHSWPIQIVDINQVSSNNYCEISIQLITSPSYEEIAFYGLNGDIVSNSNRGFVIKKDILNSQNNNQETAFSQAVLFKVPNVDVSGQKRSVSSLIRILYKGNIVFNPLDIDALWEDKKRYFLYNDIFPNLTISTNFNSNQEIKIISFEKEKIISYQGFSNYMSESILHGYIMFHKGKKIIVDSDLSQNILVKDRVLFISKKIETLDDFTIHIPKILTKGACSSAFRMGTNIDDYPDYMRSVYGFSYNIKKHQINDEGTNIHILSLDIEGQYDYCFYNLGLTGEELNILKGIIPTNSTNVNFYFHDELSNPHENISSRTPYFKYSLGIIYESNGGLSVELPINPIYVYGFNHHFLSSKEYSDFEEKANEENPIILTNVL